MRNIEKRMRGDFMNARVFHLFVENTKTKIIVQLSLLPMPHRQACALMSKQTTRAESRYFLRDAELDDFTQAYLRAALWASVDDNGEPLDAQYSIADLSDHALWLIICECAGFQIRFKTLLARAYRRYTLHNDAPTPEHCAGHDFLLTRNGHGVGFWDRKELGAIGEFLTARAKIFKGANLYVGDDKLLHVM